MKPESIINAMRSKGHKVFTTPGEVNIVAVEGMNPDGSLNPDRPNEFNDLIGIIVFDGATAPPRWACRYVGTCEPGRYWTNKPMNPGGAARLEFGQYTAWQVGAHRGHEALVQTAGPIKVRRDRNRDMTRTGDPTDIGYFGVNLHHGWNAPLSDIGRTSAGCMVIPSVQQHQSFMHQAKHDPRYRKNSRFAFTIAILPGDEL